MSAHCRRAAISRITALANVSLNQVLTRSVNTSVTSVLPVVSLLVVGAGFLGAGTLSEFAIALLIGLLVGSYSSIFVAMPAVALLKGYEPGWAAAQVSSRSRRPPRLDGSRRAGACRRELHAHRAAPPTQAGPPPLALAPVCRWGTAE